jgi:hypothetical protein
MNRLTVGLTVLVTVGIVTVILAVSRSNLIQGCLETVPEYPIFPQSTLISDKRVHQSPRNNIVERNYSSATSTNAVIAFYQDNAACHITSGTDTMLCRGEDNGGIYYVYIDLSTSQATSYTVEVGWKCEY